MPPGMVREVEKQAYLHDCLTSLFSHGPSAILVWGGAPLCNTEHGGTMEQWAGCNPSLALLTLTL